MMKKRSAEALNLDVPKLIDMLNAALSEEWLAYYQYWIGARLLCGPMRSEIESELLTHADEELEHAEKLAERILQLDGIPVSDPQEWTKLARCKYEKPTDGYVETILEQNLRGELCAIKRYEELAAFTDGKDYATFEMAVDILKEEIEHESDIINFQIDIASMQKHCNKK